MIARGRLDDPLALPEFLATPLIAEPAATEPASGPAIARIAAGVLLGALALAALGMVWLGMQGQVWAGDLAVTIAIASAPLAVLLMLWLVVSRGPSAASLARDAVALDRALRDTLSRLAAERASFAEQATLLRETAADTAREVAATALALGEETALIAMRANALEEVALTARIDLGVILADLPRAEAQIRLLGDRLRENGQVSEEATLGLERQLGRIAAAARDADGGVGGATERLTAELARVEAGGAEAGRAIELVAATVARSANEALERAGRALDAMRQAIEAENEALAGTIERARVSLERAGADRLADLDGSLVAIGERLDALTGRLASEAQSGGALVATLDRSLAEVTGRFEQLGDAGAERAAGVAEAIATLGEHVMLIEQRLTATFELRERAEQALGDAERAAAERSGARLARQVAPLIEQLNATSIDVVRLLGGEVTDLAWAEYLRGDRGRFTRSAVRLLDAGELQLVLSRYGAEPPFRDTVNRYVQDFEAMLASVLAGDEQSPLGPALLSSDMGKLYVALAQAIGRLRP